LPDTFKEYLKSLGAKERGNFSRRRTQLSKGHRVTFDVVSQVDKVASEFEGFRLLHDAQWQAEGKLGHFGDWPNAGNFHRDLVRTLGRQGMVRFYRILTDDRIISSQFCYVFRETNYWRLPARVYGEEWDRLGLGKMGCVKMIEGSLEAGLQIVEAGRGHYEYKIQLGGREWPLRTVQFVRRGPGVSARVRVFRTFASLLDLVYYKVVFARLAPRMPALRRPLWPVWIRSTW